MIDRRAFLGVLPLAALGAGRLRARSRGNRIDDWGVQLYTVRRAMTEDPDRTLAAIAGIGYTEVELAGLYGMTAREMRRKLDAVGLRAVSSHHGLPEVRDGWDGVIEGALELGQDLIVVPSIPNEERSQSGLSRVAEDFNRAGQVAADAGIRFGYHNHDWEFEALPNGTVPMDVLLDLTDADVVDWQMDVFWTVHGGVDPLAQLRRRAGRVTSVHVKDRTSAGDMVDVGDGVIDYETILADAGGRGLRHAFVEHDFPDDAIDSVRRSYRYLAGLGEPR